VDSHIREAAASVAVFAFFASVWFGWAQDKPPQAWRVPLALASVGSVLVAAVGGVLTWRHWSDPSVFDLDGKTTGQAFGVIVVIEIALAVAGAVILSRTGWSQLTPSWIAFVVGVHFVPLASLLEYPLLYPVALAVVVVAVAAVPLARSRDLAISAVTGVGTGSVLLLAAFISFAMVVH
jgi:hypothetical protein